MPSTYQFSTLPWAVLLSGLALFLAWRAMRAGDRAAAVRRVGWALVPWAVWLVGLMQLLVRIGSALTDWAAGFVFRPSVWLGLIVAVVAVGLIVLGSRWRQPSPTSGGDKAPSPRRKVGAKKERAAVDEDLDDIEAILRKHGIQ